MPPVSLVLKWFAIQSRHTLVERVFRRRLYISRHAPLFLSWIRCEGDNNFISSHFVDFCKRSARAAARHVAPARPACLASGTGACGAWRVSVGPNYFNVEQNVNWMDLGISSSELGFSSACSSSLQEPVCGLVFCRNLNITQVTCATQIWCWLITDASGKF